MRGDRAGSHLSRLSDADHLVQTLDATRAATAGGNQGNFPPFQLTKQLANGEVHPIAEESSCLQDSPTWPRIGAEVACRRSDALPSPQRLMEGWATSTAMDVQKCP